MSSAETTHPIEWRDDGAGGKIARKDGLEIARVYPDWGMWATAIRGRLGCRDDVTGGFPTASAARSFVEKSVKEAGHGE